jgi:hypothetical protein
MAYVTASEFVYIPATSEGTTVRTNCRCNDVVCGQLKHVPECDTVVCRHHVAVIDYCGGCDLESSDPLACYCEDCRVNDAIEYARATMDADDLPF